MSIEARNRRLPDWFTRIRTHQTVLPRFQRFEAWDHSRVAQMFNTILRDLPVGAGLVLEIGDKEPFISRALKGAPEVGERVTEQLLDGQQRLTALWRGLHNNYDDRTFFLYLKPDEESGLNYYVDSIARWKNDGDEQYRPIWANNPAQQWIRRMIPLNFFAPAIEAQQGFRAWAASAIASVEERDTISDEASVIRAKFAGFNLPFLSLPVTTPPQTALDVFIKMNTSASPLSSYDIVVAQLEAGMGKSLHDLVAETRIKCANISRYYPIEELTLYASALLQDRSPTNATYMAPDFGQRLIDNWDKFLNGVVRTVTFLEQERVFDAARLPTDVVIPVLVALLGLAPAKLDAKGRAGIMLKKYLWRAFFTSRYESSTNTRSLTDFKELRPLIEGTGQSEPSIFNDKTYPLPDAPELIAAGWPVRKDRLARAILALTLKNGGHDLADGDEATRENLANREYHHLFPDALLDRNGVPHNEIYCALNCALVTWHTNRNISDKDPETYLAQRCDETTHSKQVIKDRLATHYIPYEHMIAGDYGAFLTERSKLVHAAMRAACGCNV